ncbi:putative non-specific serine/threonine protein kinase [Helianthus anomalus]
MTLGECEKKCKSDCSCTTYTNSNISGTGSGCLLWFGNLIDIRTYSKNGDTLYIRMPPSELGKSRRCFIFIFITIFIKKASHDHYILAQTG